MKLLLDTHVALWAWIEPGRLSDAARNLIEDTRNDLLFAQVSTWEICLKHRIGKLPLPEPPQVYLPSRIQQLGMHYVPVEDTHLFGMVGLPRFHRDPFDWLLLATAQALAVPILSADPAMRDYPVQVIPAG